MTTRTAPVAGIPAAPPLPAELDLLLRRLRLPHIRRHAPEVIATAKAQRWEPAEVLKVLFAEEAAGRDRERLIGFTSGLQKSPFGLVSDLLERLAQACVDPSLQSPFY